MRGNDFDETAEIGTSHNNDGRGSWAVSILLLTGAHSAPAVHWPPDRCRLVVADHSDDGPELQLPPEPQTALHDERLLVQLRALGVGSVRAIAKATGRPKSTVARSLHRLARAGAIRMEPDGWRAS